MRPTKRNHNYLVKTVGQKTMAKLFKALGIGVGSPMYMYLFPDVILIFIVCFHLLYFSSLFNDFLFIHGLLLYEPVKLITVQLFKLQGVHLYSLSNRGKYILFVLLIYS